MADMETQETTVRPAARRPQFRLRTLMLVVTGCCLMLGLMKEIGPVPSVVVCLFLLLVVLHVAGNALGTSLRKEADRKRDEDGPPPSLPQALAAPAKSASRLRERTSPGLIVVALTAIGALLGGSLGSLAYAYWTDVDTAGLAVGSISAAVLGGFFGFLSSSFLKMVFRAWRQALEEMPR